MKSTRGWRWAGIVLLTGGCCLCPSTGGQVSAAVAKDVGGPVGLEGASWRLDLGNHEQPRISLPIVDLNFIRGNTLDDAEFWYILSLDRPDRRVVATALTISRLKNWQLTFFDPIPEKKWPVWNEHLDDVVFPVEFSEE